MKTLIAAILVGVVGFWGGNLLEKKTSVQEKVALAEVTGAVSKKADEAINLAIATIQKLQEENKTLNYQQSLTQDTSAEFGKLRGRIQILERENKILNVQQSLEEDSSQQISNLKMENDSLKKKLKAAESLAATLEEWQKSQMRNESARLESQRKIEKEKK